MLKNIILPYILFLLSTSFSEYVKGQGSGGVIDEDLFHPKLEIFLTNKQELIISYPISDITIKETELYYNHDTDVLTLTYLSNIEEGIDKNYKLEIDFSYRRHLKNEQIPQSQFQSSFFLQNTFFSFWRFEPNAKKSEENRISERGNCFLSFSDELKIIAFNLILSKHSQISYQLTFTEEKYSHLLEVLKSIAF